MHDRADHDSLVISASPPGKHPGFGAYGSPPAIAVIAPDGSARTPCPVVPRSAASADTLLAETLAWFEAMPPDLRPNALVATYPRIANALCAVSGNRRSFDDYMGALLTDERGQRTGFPAGVLRELLALRVHVHALHADGFRTSQAQDRR
jgi:hypothetical protein